MGHGLEPNPTVKKNRLSMDWGTLAGNWALAKLRNLLLKLAAKEVSLKAGRVGLSSGRLRLIFEEREELGCLYLRSPAVVVLSKVPRPVA